MKKRYYCQLAVILLMLFSIGCTERKVSLFYQNKSVKEIPAGIFKSGVDYRSIRLERLEDLSKYIEKQYTNEPQVKELTDSKGNFSGRVFFSVQKTPTNVPVYGAILQIRTNTDGFIQQINCNLSAAEVEVATGQNEFPDKLRKDLKNKFFLCTLTNIEEVFFDPQLLGKSGKAVMTWYVEVSVNNIKQYALLIDQQTMKIIHKVPLHTAAP